MGIKIKVYALNYHWGTVYMLYICCGSRKFIIMVTVGLHICLSWSTSVQSLSPSYLFFNIFLPSTPWFSKWSVTLRFPHQYPVHPFPLHIRATSFAHPRVLDLSTRIFVQVIDSETGRYAVPSGHLVPYAKYIPQCSILEDPHPIWYCMHRASSCNMYINQQDAQNSCD